MIKIFITDDHHIFREGLRTVLETETILRVVGEAADGLELLDKIPPLEVDVLLLDIDMPRCSGLEVIKPLLEKKSNLNILVFSMHDDEHYLRQMLKMGAKGYILKSCKKEELLLAIKTVNAGAGYFSKDVSMKSVLANQKPFRTVSEKKIPLTKREIEVVKLVAEGLTNQEIGKKLFISHRTVDTHRRNMMEKLDLHNAAALTNYAAKNNLL